MPRFRIHRPAKVALMFALLGAAAAASAAPLDMGLEPKLHEFQPAPLPPGARAFGTDGPELGVLPGVRGVTPGPTDAAPKGGEKQAEPRAPTRAELLDKLFERLAKSTDPGEAGGIATVIERIWMRSGSDTADLLMTRVIAAMGSDHRDTAGALLDKIVVLAPDWAEAWNKRATLRFMENDDAGSMADLSHVLALEPRHFGALSGMGFILERSGLNAGALKALRKALGIYPGNDDLRKAVDKLTPEVEGRDL